MPLDPQTGKEATLLCVDLALGSTEYNEVMQEFNKTMAPANYNSIVKIQRIQNPMLYSQYTAKKKNMEKHNPSGYQNEWRLFHGTPANVCPQINQQGFNRSFGKENISGIKNIKERSITTHEAAAGKQQLLVSPTYRQ